MKITITGDLGSGKSILRDKLVEKDGFIPYSTGVLQREYASKLGLTTLELNKYSEVHPEVDDYIDDGLRELSKSDKKYIIDSRMAWHFVVPSYKIYLAVSPMTAAERVFNSPDRGDIESYDNVNNTLIALEERVKSEYKRFKEKYNVDCSDMTNYDLIVDTTLLTPDEVYEVVSKAYNNKETGVKYKKILDKIKCIKL
ncbi:MAG: AAA family ATPase [Oscillospiraceae bacterium]|nr:AAA family ATPase [Oscillospiraceae bacterium]